MHAIDPDPERSNGFPARRSWRPDGSPMTSFRCPVCQSNVMADGGACRHVLLVHDRIGEVYCKTEALRALLAATERKAGRSGRPAMEALAERLGARTVFHDILDVRPDMPRPEWVWAIVDGSGDEPTPSW